MVSSALIWQYRIALTNYCHHLDGTFYLLLSRARDAYGSVLGRLHRQSGHDVAEHIPPCGLRAFLGVMTVYLILINGGFFANDYTLQ